MGVSELVLTAVLALGMQGWNCEITDVDPVDVTAVCVKPGSVALVLFDAVTGEVLRMKVKS